MNKNFNDIYNNHCDSTWATLYDDGKTLKIDTNPLDISDHIELEAWYAISDINDELGLPSALFDEIGETRALDGKQSRIYEDLGISVYWSYHPKRGVEITYYID